MPVAATLGAAVIGGAFSRSASKKAAAAQNAATQVQQDVANRQLQLAEEQWNRYKSTYGPLEDEIVQESRDYGSNANREKAAQEAQGAVTSSFAGLRRQLNETPGLDPSSAKYLNTVAKLGISEAAQGAAAQTGARRNVDVMGQSMKRDAVSLGKGLPGGSSAALQGAAIAAGATVNTSQRQIDNANMQGAAVGRMFGDVFKSIPSDGWGLFNNTTPAADVTGGIHAVVPSTPYGMMAGASGI